MHINIFVYVSAAEINEYTLPRLRKTKRFLLCMYEHFYKHTLVIEDIIHNINHRSRSHKLLETSRTNWETRFISFCIIKIT